MAVKSRDRELEIFSISFLDVISCGFGAIVILVLLSRTAVVGGVVDVERIANLLKVLSRAGTTHIELTAESQELSSAFDKASQQEKQRQTEIEKSLQKLAMLQAQGDFLDGQLVASKARLAPPTIATSADASDDPDPYVGGIPVDSNYVVFIVDTSGSMKEIWGKVTEKMSDILDIHPKVEGFQILDDMGGHLISGYKGKWIPDTRGRRKSILKLLDTWTGLSNSSPVEGLGVALRRYTKPGRKTSIYILGDDYSGASYDETLAIIAQSNINRANQQPIARIHGIGFLSPHGNAIRFGTLMREVARQSRGTFVAL